MSELDPLCGYQEGGQAAPTYAHYNRMKKSPVGARNCKIAIGVLTLVLIGLTVAVVLLFVYDKPFTEIVNNDRDSDDMLRMARGDRLYSRLHEYDDRSSELDDSKVFPSHSKHPLVVSPRHSKPHSGHDWYNQFSRFNKDGHDSHSSSGSSHSGWHNKDSGSHNSNSHSDGHNPYSRFNKDSGWRRHHEDSRSSSDWKSHKLSLTAGESALIRECLQKGRDEVARRKELEKTFDPPTGAAFYHQLATALIPEAAEELDGGVISETLLRCLKEQNLGDFELLKKNSSDWSGIKYELPQCNKEPQECDATYKYRSLDGTCNNLKHGRWGSKLQPYRRLLPADYVDGLGEPKPSFPKGRYPPPRQVSICMQNATNKWSETRANLLFAHFAHFVDHDISSIAAYKGANKKGIACCDHPDHPECYNLEVKDNDPFYRDLDFEVTCMDFVRSAAAPVCSLGPREQWNQQTAYIDLSNIYSVNEFEGRKILRDIAGGYLRSPTEADGRYMLLRNMDPNDGCNTPEMVEANTPCFKSGDPRVNTFIGLTAMTQAWMREHNRVTDFLIKINPHWDDERLYQESRRIVVAEVQNVIYNEFLPMLFGEKMTKQLKIRPLRTGYYTTYDESVNAQISNAFTAAAFRFYHSMYRGHVGFNDHAGSNGYKELEGTWYYVLAHTMEFSPFILWHFGTVDALWRGAAATFARPMHNSFAHDHANHLFQPPGNDTYGFDIFAFDIQRGRDHGLPPYYKFREYCKLPPASTFAEFEPYFRPHSLEVIQRFYEEATHLDLFTGMLAETPLEDGILGPVSACIIGDQFVRLKDGDRFWFETPDPLLRFTPEQLETIRNVTLARVLCDNGDDLDMLPGRAMEGISETNPLLHCSGYQIHRLDLTRWVERDQQSN